MKRSLIPLALITLVFFMFEASNSQAISTPTLAQFTALQKQIRTLEGRITTLESQASGQVDTSNSISTLEQLNIGYRLSNLETRATTIETYDAGNHDYLVKTLGTYQPSDIYYYSLGSCRAPADLVTSIPIPSSYLCHLRVLATQTSP